MPAFEGLLPCWPSGLFCLYGLCSHGVSWGSCLEGSKSLRKGHRRRGMGPWIKTTLCTFTRHRDRLRVADYPQPGSSKGHVTSLSRAFAGVIQVLLPLSLVPSFFPSFPPSSTVPACFSLFPRSLFFAPAHLLDAIQLSKDVRSARRRRTSPSSTNQSKSKHLQWFLMCCSGHAAGRGVP